MVDVVIGPNGTLQIILFHVWITAFDNFDHLCAVGVEFVVALRGLGAVGGSEELVGHTPEEERHLLLHKLFENFRNLEVEL